MSNIYLIIHRELETGKEPGGSTPGKMTFSTGNAPGRSPSGQLIFSTGNHPVNSIPYQFFTLKTLEPPDRNNAATRSWKTSGRIPAGTYPAHVRTNGSKSWSIKLEKVPNRTNIQIKLGETPKDTKGEILIGTGSAKDRLFNSKNHEKNAETQLQQLINRAITWNKNTRIFVTIKNP
jgi:hypothetical protein